MHHHSQNHQTLSIQWSMYPIHHARISRRSFFGNGELNVHNRPEIVLKIAKYFICILFTTPAFPAAALSVKV